MNRRELLGAGAGALAGLLGARSSDGDASPTVDRADHAGAARRPRRRPPRQRHDDGAGSEPSTVPAGAVDDLRRRLQGNVLTPDDASYDRIRAAGQRPLLVDPADRDRPVRATRPTS